MMCALTAGRRGRSVGLIDHARAPGEKIRISGGGRCNFTNIHAGPKNYLSGNRHFMKSALARYTPADFIAMVDRHGIAWHEKTLGQLFCDDSAKDIIRMLLEEMRAGGVDMRLGVEMEAVERNETGFRLQTSDGEFRATALVIATGGKSIPKMGATGLAYRIAEQFGRNIGAIIFPDGSDASPETTLAIIHASKERRVAAFVTIRAGIPRPQSE